MLERVYLTPLLDREREKAAVRDGDREEGELMLSGSVVQGRRKRGQRTMPCWARGSAAELAKEQGAGVVAVIGLAWSSSTVLAQFGSNKVDIGLKPFPLPLPTFICKFSTSSSLSFTISHFCSSSPPLAQHRRHIHLSNLSLAAALPNIATDLYVICIQIMSLITLVMLIQGLFSVSNP